MARFIDAPSDVRCTTDITLGDGSKAQCGRRRVDGSTRCWQHLRLALAKDRDEPIGCQYGICDADATHVGDGRPMCFGHASRYEPRPRPLLALPEREVPS